MDTSVKPKTVLEMLTEEMNNMKHQLSKLEQQYKDLHEDINEICNDIYGDDATKIGDLLNNDISLDKFIEELDRLGYDEITIHINEDGTCDMDILG